MRALPGQASRQPPGAKLLTREEAGAQQRSRILATASALFAKRGYHNTTVELIVRRAKVGYATFYKNYRDKEECFLDVIEQASGAAIGRAERAFANAATPWSSRISCALRAFFTALTEDPAGARVFVVESLTAGPIAVGRYEDALKKLEPMLREGRVLNARGAEFPDTLEGTLAGGVLWIAYQRLIIGEVEKLMELLPETIEFVLTPYVGEAEAVRVAHDSSAGCPD